MTVGNHERHLGATGSCRAERRPPGSASGGEVVAMSRELKPTISSRSEVNADAHWLSIRQIAADLGVSASTAYKWSARGKPWFPRSIRLRNGDIRIRRDWYEAWLAELEQ